MARDETVFELVTKINISIEETIKQCKRTQEYLNAFNYLWTSDIHVTFDEFLKGNTSISRHKQVRPPSKNMASKTVTKYTKSFLNCLKSFNIKWVFIIAGVSLHLEAYFHLK